jgi:cobalamin biosynthesis protein CobD/CbiB
MENHEILDDGLLLPKKPVVGNEKAIRRLKRDFSEELKKVKHGRYAIIGLIVIQAIGGFVQMYAYDFDIGVVVINSVVVLVLIGLYFYSLKSPYLAFILTLFSLFALIALLGIADPMSIVKGILWKSIIIYYLVMGLGPASDIKHTASSLRSYGIDVVDIS